MAIFDYVMLLISVVLSLGLARLLETHARLLKRGAAVRWSATVLRLVRDPRRDARRPLGTLWAVHTQTHWPWTVVLGFFFQAVSLLYGSVLLAPDEKLETVDLRQFHLANRRRYPPTLILYTVLGCGLAATFVPLEQFLSAVYTVGVPIVAACVLAMATERLWAQRAIACAIVVWIAWYFVTYLPGFGT